MNQKKKASNKFERNRGKRGKRLGARRRERGVVGRVGQEVDLRR